MHSNAVSARRYFVTSPALVATLGVLMLGAPLAAGAQQAGKVPRVGVLVAVSAAFAAPYIDAGRQALRDVGYAEGQNIILEFRFADFRDRKGFSNWRGACSSQARRHGRRG